MSPVHKADIASADCVRRGVAFSFDLMSDRCVGGRPNYRMVQTRSGRIMFPSDLHWVVGLKVRTVQIYFEASRAVTGLLG